jgi:tetratricopeptide (TPR) repeat protein
MNISRQRLLSVALAVFAGTVWLYWPSTLAGFLKVDDVEYLRQAGRRGGLTWNAVKWAFTSTDAYYQPLVRLSHVLVYQIWGRDASAHHAVNVFLHALNAALMFGFLWTLLTCVSLTARERLAMATCVSVVFAIHPLQTESVAWLAVRTQLLCTMFGIGSLWAYTAGLGRPIVWSLYLAALLCKPTAVSLPFVMLAIDYFPLRRHERLGWGRLVREKAVLIGCAGMLGVATLITEPEGGSTAGSIAVPLSVRVVRAFENLVFYPLKLIWPCHLSPNYFTDIPLGSWITFLAVPLVVIIAAVAVIERRRAPLLMAAWGAYLVLALPMLPLMPKGRQVVAMRYAYEPILPLLLLVGSAGVWLWRRSTPAIRDLLVALLACELCFFVAVTRRLIPDWRTDETMRRATLAEFPNSEEANRALAIELSDEQRPSEALVYAQRGVELAPQVSEAHATLGRVLNQLNRLPEAIDQNQQALRINPESANANFGLGCALMRSGKLPEAVQHYERALRIKPDLVEAHCNLGIALAQAGRLDEAIGHFEHALRINPESANANFGLGYALMRSGKLPEAAQYYEQALRVRPDMIEAQCNLGVVLTHAGRLDEAIGHLEHALRIAPENANAHNDLGNALVLMGRVEEGMFQYGEALRINPNFATAHYNLGSILLSKGKVREAGEHYQKALDLRPDSPVMKDALARLQTSQ